MACTQTQNEHKLPRRVALIDHFNFNPLEPAVVSSSGLYRRNVAARVDLKSGVVQSFHWVLIVLWCVSPA